MSCTIGKFNFNTKYLQHGRVKGLFSLKTVSGSPEGTPPHAVRIEREDVTPLGRKSKKKIKGVKRVLDFSQEILSPPQVDTAHNLFLSMHNSLIELRMDSVAHAGTHVGRMCCMDDARKFSYLTAINIERHTCDFKSTSTSCFGVYDLDQHTGNDVQVKLGCCFKPCTLNGQSMCNEKNSVFFVFNCVPIEAEEKDRRHCCYFCKKRISDVSHHLKNMHKDEEQVQIVLRNPPYSKERTAGLQRLRNMGDRLLDANVKLNDRLPVRKPSMTTVSTYIKCSNCEGLYARLNYSRHERLCNSRPSNQKRVLPIDDDETVATGSTESSVDKALGKVLARLHDDETKHVIYSDAALLAFARHYSVGAMFSDTKGKNVRMQLRLLARLLLTARSIDYTIVNFKEVLSPENHDLVLTAVRLIVGMDIENRSIEKPSLALLLSSCLTNLATVYKNSVLNHSQDKATIEAINNFLTCHKGSFTEQVSKPSYKIRATRRALVAKTLPTCEDVHFLMTHLDKKLHESYEQLRDNAFDYNVWLTLGKSVLVSIMVFNRRRIGEMSQMNLDLYQQKEKVSEQDKTHMTRLEKALAEHWTVVKLIAKRVRQVTVILNDRHLRYVDMFLSLRVKAGVPDTNRYLFGVPNQNLYIDASQALRQLSNECGASKPDTLRATLFRKQVATLSQMLQLSDNEIQQLADSLGHNVDVHKRYYRVPHLVQEATIMAKFFMAVNDENIERFRGKTIQELEVEVDNETSDQEEDSQPTLDLQDLDEEPDEGQTVVVASPIKQNRPIKDMNMRQYKQMKAMGSPGKIPSKALEEMYRCSPPKKFQRTPWTPQELAVLNNELSIYIERRRFPKNFKILCQELFAKHRGIFIKKRTHQHVYSFLQYRIKQKLPN